MEHLRGSIAELKQRIVNSVFVEAAGSQKSRHQAVQEEINVLYLSLHLYREGGRELQRMYLLLRVCVCVCAST